MSISLCLGTYKSILLCCKRVCVCVYIALFRTYNYISYRFVLEILSTFRFVLESISLYRFLEPINIYRFVLERISLYSFVVEPISTFRFVLELLKFMIYLRFSWR
jgi:hypothetical protein